MAGSSAESLVQGAIETHVHSAPDIVPRRINDFDLAAHAKEAGMRAVVLKSHHTQTADRAQLVRHVVSGIDVFGGIALNYPAGGLNYQAVEMALGFGAKVVWMPTYTAANHVAHMAKGPGHEALTALGSSPDAGIRAVLDDGSLAPALEPILKLIAERGATLATGHLSWQESRVLVPAAKRLGVERILITHPELDLVDMPLEVQKELAGLGGVYFERCFIITTMGDSAQRLIEGIRAVGPETTVMATDFGQLKNPTPVDGMRQYVQAMLDGGLTPDEIQLMLHHNPALALGLET